MLTQQQKEHAINHAMMIECGTEDCRGVVEAMERDPLLAVDLITFYMTFNKMTQSALEIILCEKNRRHLERCVQQMCEGGIND